MPTRFGTGFCVICGHPFDKKRSRSVTCRDRDCIKKHYAILQQIRRSKTATLGGNISIHDRPVMATIQPMIEPDKCASCCGVFREGQTRYDSPIGQVHGGCRP